MCFDRESFKNSVLVLFFVLSFALENTVAQDRTWVYGDFFARNQSRSYTLILAFRTPLSSGRFSESILYITVC